MPEPDPLVITLTPYASGLTNSEDDPDFFPAIPLSEALSNSWPDDRHFVCYQVPELDSWPRINKGGQDLMPSVSASVTALDWDTPGHLPLTSAYKDFLLQAFEDHPTVPQPTYTYWTSHGARFVYVHEPTTLEDQEDLHRGLAALLSQANIHCDPACSQWTRLFRLPNVVRDNHPVSSPLRTGPPLTLPNVPRIPASSVSVSIARRPQSPDIDQAMALVFTPRSHNLTAWAKKAQRRCQGRCDGEIDELFTDSPPPIPPSPLPDNPAKSSRNWTLMKWAGSLVHQTEYIADTSPEHLFGLMVLSIQQSDQPAGRCFFAEAWKAIWYAWNRHYSKREAERLAGQSILERTISLIKDTWPSPPNLDAEWVRKHLVISTGRASYFVLQANGLYDSVPVSSSMHLFGALRDCGLCGPAKPFPISTVTSHGQRAMRPEEIMNAYHTRVDPTVLKKLGPRGGWLENNQLNLGTYQRRTDLPAKFDPQVDQWLQQMFGEHYERAARWIGLALAFERGPICALSINGEPGIGKKMLVRGLAECVTPEKPPATGDGVFGRWQYSLDESPFLNVNEGWPPRSGDVSTRYRNLVSGDGQTVDQKYSALSLVSVAPRIILTANNRSVIERLFQKKAISNSDLKALAQRTLHLELNEDAAKWLEARGGLAFTNGWIKGDRGEASRYVVAQHFLALYEQYGQAGGASRFLMEGATDPRTLFSFVSQTEDASVIGELLVNAVKAGEYDLDTDGIMRVTVNRMLKFHRMGCGGDANLRRFTAPGMNKALLPFRLEPEPLDEYLDVDSMETRRGRAIDAQRVKWFAESTMGVDVKDLNTLATGVAEWRRSCSPSS